MSSHITFLPATNDSENSSLLHNEPLKDFYRLRGVMPLKDLAERSLILSQLTIRLISSASSCKEQP